MSGPLFQVDNLCFLDNGPYTFTITEGQIVGFTGSSGIGKTQLMKALVEAIPYTGEIVLAGRKACEYSAPHWRKMVSFVPAESSWWRSTVGEHFQREDKNIDNLLQSLGLDKAILQWKIRRLSSGERQRLALVRVLLLSPAILLLDEPSSALDAESTEQVERCISEFSDLPGKAVLLVSHDLDQLRRLASVSYRVAKNELVPL